MKPSKMIAIILVLLLVVLGCNGPLSGSVSGKVSFEVEPAALQVNNNYPIIPLARTSASFHASFLNNEKICTFKEGLSETEITTIVSSIGGKIKTKIKGTKSSYVIIMNDTNSNVNLTTLNPNIIAVSSNIVLHASQIPNDPMYQYQWNYRMLDLPQAWDISAGTYPVIVAVIDSGVSLTHPDLIANLMVSNDVCNFVANNNNPTDDFGHGTHVAGIIDANTNNNLDVAGITWNANVKILPVKILDASGSGSIDQLISGLHYAIAKGAKVINLSLGVNGITIDQVPPAFKDELNNAIANNVTIVAAAGNEGTAQVDFPANCPGVIAVGALGPDGNRAQYSNYGPEIAVCAPGGANPPITDKYSQMILSTYYDPVTKSDTCAYMCGTSMATPHIAGLAALLYSQNPGITAEQVRQRLQSFVYDKGTPGIDPYYGYGMPNAYEVLSGKQTRIDLIKIYTVSSGKDIETSLTPDGIGNYNINNISAGNKYICAFLDTNLNGKVDSGDLFGYVVLPIRGGMSFTNINITLRSVQILNPAPSLADYLKVTL